MKSNSMTKNKVNKQKMSKLQLHNLKYSGVFFFFWKKYIHISTILLIVNEALHKSPANEQD